MTTLKLVTSETNAVEQHHVLGSDGRLIAVFVWEWMAKDYSEWLNKMNDYHTYVKSFSVND